MPGVQCGKERVIRETGGDEGTRFAGHDLSFNKHGMRRFWRVWTE